MKVRVAVLALITVAVLGACGAEAKKPGGVVEPAATSDSTVQATVTTTAPTTASTAAPSTTTNTAKVTTTTAKPTTTTTERATTTTSSPANTSVYYGNCDAVRAAGMAPLYTGDPGYSTKLDRDRDGVACE